MMPLRSLGLGLLLLLPALAQAELPAQVVRAMLSGEPSSVEDAFTLADEFRTGQGSGVWQSDCLAKYFYKIGIDAANLANTPPDQPALRAATAAFQALVDKHAPCQVYFTGATDPKAPLNTLVLVNGAVPDVVPQPGSSGAMPAPAPAPVLAPAQVAGVPIPPQYQPPPVLPPPFDSGQPAEQVMVNPGAAANAGRGPVVLEAGPGGCAATWSLYGQMQESMRDYALMSFLVYASDLPIRRAEAAVADLDRRIALAKPDVRLLLKQQRTTAEADLAELVARRQRKDELAALGYRARDDLMRAFYASRKLTVEALDAADFYAEIYERDGFYVVAFRGTSQMAGWIADGKQIVNAENQKGRWRNGIFDPLLGLDQARTLYGYADQLIGFLIKSGRIAPQRIATTGHSLGGGLAVYSHLRNETSLAMGFNPAELSENHNAQVAKSPARNRVLNYMSYIPGTDAADFVHQGSAVAKETLPLMELPNGYQYGHNFYLPVPVGRSPWKLAKYGSILAGAASTSLSGSAAVAGIAAHGAVTSDEHVNTGVARVAEGLVVSNMRSFIRHPIRSAALAGVGAAVGYNKIAPLENLLWGLTTLHIMAPLAGSAVGLYADPRELTCAGPPTPAFVVQQVDTQHRAAAFARMVTKIAAAK